MWFFWIIALLFCRQLYAGDISENALPMADQNGGISSIVNGCVSAITGNYLERALDLHIVGPEPVNFERYHCSFDSNSCSLMSTWSHNYSTFGVVSIDKIDKVDSLIIFIKDMNGGTSHYTHKKAKKGYIPARFNSLLKKNKGFSNIGKDTLHASSNPKNGCIHINKPGQPGAVLTTGDGSQRTYYGFDISDEKQGLKLAVEKKPNGNLIKYEHDKKHMDSTFHLFGFKTLNSTGKLLSEVKLHQKCAKDFKKDPRLVVEGSNGQRVTYHFSHRSADKKKRETYFLTKIESPLHPTEIYEYDFQKDDKLIGKIKAKRRPDGRFLLTEYYVKGHNSFSAGDATEVRIESIFDPRIDRVKLQKAPLGTDSTPIISHRYFYDINRVKVGQEWDILCGRTDVYDAYSNRVSYYFDNDHRLVSTIKFTVNDASQIHSNEVLSWGVKGTTEDGCLKSRRLVDGAGKTLHERIYIYDERSNVICDSFVGNLSGWGEHPNESIIKEYTYSNDDYNLLLTENDFLTKTLYAYTPNTNLLTEKLVTVEGSIVKREFYAYDENAMMIQKIIDDGTTNDVQNLTGVTERFTTNFTRSADYPTIGVPIQEEIYYLELASGQPKLLKKTTTNYTREGRPEFQTIYDSDNIPRYSLERQYDAMGKVTMEQNALGYKIHRRYENGNLVWEQGPHGSYEKRHAYDLCDRRIKTESLHCDGKHLVNTCRYNYLHQCVSTTDMYGSETDYAYDVAGNIIKTTLPALINENGAIYRPVETFEYNAASQQIKTVNAAGGITQKIFNSRGKVAFIQYPDGTTESNHYNHWGSLVEATAINGIKTFFSL